MSDALERSLDEIIGSDSARNPHNDSSRDRRHNDRFHNRSLPRNSRSSETYRDRYERPRKTKLQRLSNGKCYLKITNLHPDITDDDLRQLFENVGKTLFSIIENDHGRKDSRIGYIGYEDPSLIPQAVEKFDGRKAVGQIITVEEIRPLNVLGIDSRPSSTRSEGRRRIPGRDGYHGRAGVTRARTRATPEDLDRDLENYMNNAGSPSSDQQAPLSSGSSGRGSGRTARPKPTVEDLDKELEQYMDSKPFPVAN